MVQASRRKFHYIYKITRIDTGKYYIGMHSTDNLEDGYFGSGKLISASVKKHGKEKHLKEILEYCDSRESLKVREKELVSKDVLEDKLCLNLRIGGEGGGGFKNEDHAYAFHKAGWAAMMAAKDHFASNAKVAEAVRKNGTHRSGLTAAIIAKGTKAAQADEARARRKSTMVSNGHQQKEKNSQFGKQWIYNDTLKQCSLIRNDEIIPDGWKKGRKIRF